LLQFQKTVSVLQIGLTRKRTCNNFLAITDNLQDVFTIGQQKSLRIVSSKTLTFRLHSISCTVA